MAESRPFRFVVRLVAIFEHEDQNSEQKSPKSHIQPFSIPELGHVRLGSQVRNSRISAINLYIQLF